jgi:hypothetical protein
LSVAPVRAIFAWQCMHALPLDVVEAVGVRAWQSGVQRPVTETRTGDEVGVNAANAG